LGSTLSSVDLSLNGRFQHASIYHRANANHALQHYIRWLHTNLNNRTFAYLQLADLHARIRVPNSYRSAFGKIPHIPRLGRWDYQEGVITGDPGFESYRENRIKLYDTALLYVDAQFRKLFQWLNDFNLKDKTLVVITADHGEEMWDHWQFEKDHFFDPRQKYGVAHGHHLWQELVRVPLLILGPEISAQKVKRRVSLIDLMPTVLQSCGIKGWEELGLDGQSLLDSIDNRVILAEDVCYGYEKKAVFEGKYKLYYSKGDGVQWIFDLENDPYEKTPLEVPAVADRLMGFITETVDNKEEERLSMDEETRSRLRDLGYIE
jgi:membrane-anchored protein YejM (alkaline phosphatase superfamily)